MKQFRFFKIFTVALITGALLTFSACSDDDDSDTVDKTELAAKIQEAEDLLANTAEGTAIGQYIPGSKAPLQEVVDLSQTVYDNEEATQVEVNNAVVALDQAILSYEAMAVTPIAPDAMVGHWTFDEAEGNTLNDYSGNDFHGTLMSGADTWGGGLPVWSEDRYGNAGGALFFNEGAYVSIPNSAAFSPANISISLWINAAEVLENNRFIGLHSWNGYKFQLQAANKSFFTLATTDGIYDRDTDPPLEINEWYHLAVTFGNGEMTFYIDGTQTQVWDNTPGTALPVSGNALVFGRDSDEYAADDSNYDNDLIIPLAWGGYFHGLMDEVRIYNTVLTASQVQSIYEVEKP
ncbi:MAG: LamG domain-containing protein [Bacteroidota bacterium]